MAEMAGVWAWAWGEAVLPQLDPGLEEACVPLLSHHPALVLEEAGCCTNPVLQMVRAGRRSRPGNRLSPSSLLVHEHPPEHLIRHSCLENLRQYYHLFVLLFF